MIPKIASFYWGNERMSYLRYLTLASFRKQNPDWRMRLVRRASDIGSTWETGESFDKFDYKGPDYTDRIAALDVQMVPWDEPYIDRTFGPISDIHASDILTWKILSTVGGIVSDMDILYTKPVPESLLEVNAAIVQFKTRAMNGETRYGYRPVSLLAACEGNRFFEECLAASERTFSPGVYESCGTPVLKLVSDNWPYEDPAHWPDGIVYPFQRRAEVSFGGILNATHVADAREWMDRDAIGIHWYAGSDIASRHNFAVTHETIKDHRDTICLLAQGMGF